MADFPLGGVTEINQHGIIQATRLGTAITASATPNVKGAYTEIVSGANNLYDSVSIEIGFDGASDGTMKSILVDIAIGEPGSEQVIIPNLYLSSRLIYNPQVTSIPLSIPAGVRISARMQSTVASAVGLIYIRLSAGNFKSYSPINTAVSYGENLSNSSGVTVIGETTYGPWTEITASTNEDLKGFFVCVSNSIDGWSGSPAFYDVGIGAASSETVIVEKQMTSQNSNETGTELFSPYMPIEIPVGSRIAIRALTNSNADFDMEYVLIGVC